MEVSVLVESARRASQFALPQQKAWLADFIRSPSMATFQKIPSINKSDLFSNSLWLKSVFDQCKKEHCQIILSAGSSTNSLSFRFAKEIDLKKSLSQLVGLVLSEWNLKSDETMVLNCYPLGTTLPDSIGSVDIGNRLDLIPRVADAMQSSFRQFVIVGYPSAVSWCLANGLVPQSSYFLVGGERVPSFLTHQIARNLNLSLPDAEGRLFSLYGLAEIGAGLGFCSPKLRSSSLEIDQNSYFVDPSSYHCEVESEELLITSGPSSFAPLIRYRTHDRVKIIASSPEHFIFKFIDRLQSNNQLFAVERQVLATFSEMPRNFLGLKTIASGEVQLLFAGDPPARLPIAQGPNLRSIKIQGFDGFRKNYANVY